LRCLKVVRRRRAAAAALCRATGYLLPWNVRFKRTRDALVRYATAPARVPPQPHCYCLYAATGGSYLRHCCVNVWFCVWTAGRLLPNHHHSFTGALRFIPTCCLSALPGGTGRFILRCSTRTAKMLPLRSSAFASPGGGWFDGLLPHFYPVYIYVPFGFSYFPGWPYTALQLVVPAVVSWTILACCCCAYGLRTACCLPAPPATVYAVLLPVLHVLPASQLTLLRLDVPAT